MTVLLTWSAAGALLWLPGAALLRLLRTTPHPDWLVVAALQVAAGMAFWPLLLLWTTWLGWSWSPQAAQAAAAAALLAGAAALLWAPREAWRRRRLSLRRQAVTLTLFACVLALAAGVRWLHVRDLALPAWVDSVHHVALVRLIAAQGRLPDALDPFIPGGLFNYHWGFHALAAWQTWLLRLSNPFAVADLVLAFGQVVNVLAVLAAYAGARVLFSSSRAGLLAAAVTGTISWFPAYFVSWGRYTHLAGAVLLPIAVIALWRLRIHLRWGNGLAAALTIAGLGLVHVRLAYFGAVLVAILGLLLVRQRQWRPLAAWAAAAGAALLATLPWWLRLGQSSWVQSVVTALPPDSPAWKAWEASNQIDWSLVWAPRGDLLFAAATAGLSDLLAWPGDDPWRRGLGAVMLAAAVGLAVWCCRTPRLRRITLFTWQRWLLLWIWIAATAGLLQLDRVGLPAIGIANLNSAVMTLYLPLALAAGGLAAWALGALLPAGAAPYAAGVTVLAVGIWGAGGMTAIVNPSTVLASAADRTALAWIQENTPPDAKFAVNVWPWQAGTYAGVDGGYWIAVLTDRGVVVPPALYSSTLPPQRVQALDSLLFQLSAATNLDDAALRNLLRAAGVTHLYVSERAGMLQPAQIDGRPFARLIYRRDGVSIYALAWE